MILLHSFFLFYHPNKQISIIYSYENGRSAQEEELLEGGNERYCPGYVVSGTDEYKQLASLTGGIFVEIDKFDIDEVLGIMEDAVEQSKVCVCVCVCGSVNTIHASEFLHDIHFSVS